MGAYQVKTYIASLDRAFENLAAYPDAGRWVNNLREGYLRFKSEQHAVFYQKTGNGILVVRVLHQKRSLKYTKNGKWLNAWCYRTRRCRSASTAITPLVSWTFKVMGKLILRSHDLSVSLRYLYGLNWDSPT